MYVVQILSSSRSGPAISHVVGHQPAGSTATIRQCVVKASQAAGLPLPNRGKAVRCPSLCLSPPRSSSLRGIAARIDSAKSTSAIYIPWEPQTVTKRMTRGSD